MRHRLMSAACAVIITLPLYLLSGVSTVKGTVSGSSSGKFGPLRSTLARPCEATRAAAKVGDVRYFDTSALNVTWLTS